MTDTTQMTEELQNATVREEFAVGRRHTPDFAWPTVFLFFAIFAVFGAATWLAVAGHVPYWAAGVVNTVVIYALYTIVHEATHDDISCRMRGRRWVDVVLGFVSCVPLWLFFFEHRKQHMVHHTKTNMDDDPDIYSRGGFLGWIFVRLPKALVNYFNPFERLRECRRFNVPRHEVAITMVTFALQWAALIAMLWAGWWYELLVLWFVPWWIGQTVMLTLFTWIPHHDHSETGRYRNTRVSLFPGGDALLLGQNLHLIHHMMPAVPFYRYRAVFDDLRPLLEKKGARIEGLWPHPERHQTAAA